MIPLTQFHDSSNFFEKIKIKRSKTYLGFSEHRLFWKNSPYKIPRAAPCSISFSSLLLLPPFSLFSSFFLLGYKGWLGMLFPISYRWEELRILIGFNLPTSPSLSLSSNPSYTRFWGNPPPHPWSLSFSWFFLLKANSSTSPTSQLSKGIGIWVPQVRFPSPFLSFSKRAWSGFLKKGR